MTTTDPTSKECLECGQQIGVRADGKFVMHAIPGLPIECHGSGEAAYAADQRPAPESAIAADLSLILPRVRDQLTLTPDERAAVKRLEAVAAETGSKEK